MKVAFVSFYFGEYCVRLASGISQDRDTDIHLFLAQSEADPYLHLLSQSVSLHTFEKPRPRSPFHQARMAGCLVRQIKEFNPDVIHFQSAHSWFTLALPMLNRFPLILTAHDASIHPGDMQSRKTPQWVHDRWCYLAKERIVHAPQVKELLLQRLRIPSDTVHVIPHVLIGENAAALIGTQDEEPVILFFGRIWEYKGLEYLIRAEPLVTHRVPQARIVIAGTGENFARYRKAMVHPDRFIVYNEYVSDEKRAELFRRASIVVLPYIEASQSGVIPIAYRFGKPVVVTSVGGLPAMVDHGRTGYIVPPRNETALAEAIVHLLQNDKMRREFGEYGRQKVNTECAPEAVGEMTRAVYRKIVATTRVAPLTTASSPRVANRF